jgi:hypothetical protein
MMGRPGALEKISNRPKMCDKVLWSMVCVVLVLEITLDAGIRVLKSRNDV